MNIVIGSDHHGFKHKESIREQSVFGDHAVTWIDVGAFDEQRSDYPVFTKKAIAIMRESKASRGVLLCGTGVGMAIAANRYSGIYAALAWNQEIARQAREHDNANVLVIPSDYVSHEQAIEMIRLWLSVEFLGDRYQHRIAMIDDVGGV